MHEGAVRTFLQGQADTALGEFERTAPVIRPMILPVQKLSKGNSGIRLAVAWILDNRLRKKVGRPIERLAVPRRRKQELTAGEEQVVRLAAGRFDVAEPRGFVWAQFNLQGVDDPPGDLVLNRENVGQLAVEIARRKWPPVPASISCAVVLLTRPPARRMLPSRTERTPSSRAT